MYHQTDILAEVYYSLDAQSYIGKHRYGTALGSTAQRPAGSDLPSRDADITYEIPRLYDLTGEITHASVPCVERHSTVWRLLRLRIRTIGSRWRIRYRSLVTRTDTRRLPSDDRSTSDTPSFIEFELSALSHQSEELQS